MPHKDPEARRAYARAHYLANQERIRERVRLYRLANADKKRAWDRAYYLVIRDRVLARNRATYAWLASIKMERGCEATLDDGSVCGYRRHPAALDFDHRDPSTKRFTISGALNKTRQTLLAEIDKCDVVCACCHRIRTQVEGHSFIRRTEPFQLGDPQPSLFDEVAA